MKSQVISYSPLIIPSPNPLLKESLYNVVPHPHPKKPKRIPTPIILNKQNEKPIDSNNFSLKQADDLFLLVSEDKKDTSFTLSLSSTSETEDEVNDLPDPGESFTQYRRMLKKCKSRTVKEKSLDTESIITNERVAREYSGLASKILIPYKKNSCVDPSVKNKLEEISLGENKDDNDKKNKYDFYMKRNPRMRRGFSILDILELTCGNSDNMGSN